MAQYVLERPNQGKIAVLHSPDERSQDFLNGLESKLSRDKDVSLVKIAIDSTQLSAARAIDTLRGEGIKALIVAAPFQATLAVMTVIHNINWRLEVIVPSDFVRSLGSLPENSLVRKDVVSIRYLKDGRDPLWSQREPFRFAEFPRWDNDPGVQAYREFVMKHVPGVEIDYLRNVPKLDIKSEAVEFAYSTAQLMVQLLTQCRGNVTMPSAA